MVSVKVSPVFPRSSLTKSNNNSPVRWFWACISLLDRNMLSQLKEHSCYNFFMAVTDTLNKSSKLTVQIHFFEQWFPYPKIWKWAVEVGRRKSILYSSLTFFSFLSALNLALEIIVNNSLPHTLSHPSPEPSLTSVTSSLSE